MIGSSDDEEAFEPAASPQQQPDEVAHRGEQVAQLAIALDAQPDEQREAFVLREEGGLRFEEIPATTNVGKKSVALCSFATACGDGGVPMNKSSANLQFEQYLDGASLLSARYRETGGEQPPMHLDVRILCAAIQRVCAQTGNSSERGFAPFSQHWAWPMSLAAVVVLSVSLVVIVQPQADSVGEPQIPLPRALDRSRPSPATPPVPRPLAEQQADGVQRGCENRSVLAPLWHAHKLAPSSEAPARCNAKETNSSGLSPSTHVHYEQWYDQRPRSRLTTYPIERASRQRYCSRSSAA